MNSNPKTLLSAAAILTSLLLTAFPAVTLAQTDTPASTDTKSAAAGAGSDVVVLAPYTVTTGSRSPKAVDQIPGAVTLVPQQEVLDSLLITEDVTAVLARTIPGYTESSQMMSSTGETLRGRTALRLFDGIPKTTPLRETDRSGSFTDLGIIGRIEVINGPSATEGIGAAGGIINYLSITPTKDGNETQLTLKYSSQGYSDSNDWKTGLTFTHKENNSDVVVGVSMADRGITHDANGRIIGMNQSGSLADTQEHNIFVKAGYNFGTNNMQRISLTVSSFNLAGKSNYSWSAGSRALGIPDTAVRSSPLGAKSEFNNFNQYILSYNHNDLFGGILTLQAYKASQAMRFLTDNSTSKEDPAIAPLGQLIDQSEVNSQKEGIRSDWDRKDLFISGLELNIGLDMVTDRTEQKLALTNRTWVPPMKYISYAPFVQLSYNKGPVTISAGLRDENGKLDIKSWTSTWYNNRVFVTGGTLKYSNTLPNAGVVYRLPGGWSVFGSYSKGFSLPNVGIPLRNINKPNVTVAGLVSLQAIIADNKEGGLAWHGRKGGFSASYYESYSDFGSSLGVDPVTQDFVLLRNPVKIKGLEFSGEFKATKTLKFTSLFSHTVGTTSTTAGGPLNTRLGIINVGPDKLREAVAWAPLKPLSVAFGATTLLGHEINIGKSSYEKIYGYTVYDLSGTYHTKYGDFSVGVENLMNKFYILSFNQVDFFENYFAGRGRTVSGTYTIKF